METHVYEFPPEERLSYEKLPVPLAVFQLLRDSRPLLLASDGLCRCFAVDRAALMRTVGSEPAALLHPEDRAKLRPDLESACLDPAGAFSGLYRVLTGPDSCCWISCSGSVRRIGDGCNLLFLTVRNVDDEMRRSRETDSAQRRRELLFSKILETTDTAIFWKDADRRFLGANRAFLDYYGFADERAIIGKNDEDMNWHPEPESYKNDELRVLREGESTCRVPGVCVIRGESRNIVASKRPILADGKIVGLVGSFEDVTTECRQREEISKLNAELQQHMSEMDMLMESTGVNISKIRLDRDFTLEWCNDIMYRSIGYPREEFERLYHHKMRLYYAGEYQSELEALRENILLALREGQPRVHMILRMPTREGFTWINGVGTFTDFDPESGHPRSLFAVYTDVSEVVDMQKRLHDAEEKARHAYLLENENARLQRIVDSVPSGIGFFRIQKDGKQTITLNRYFLERVELPGASGNTVELDRLPSCIHPNDRRRCRQDIRRICEEKQPVSAMYRFRRVGGGAYYWGKIRSKIVRLSDGEEACYIVFTNENELKTAEADLRESRRFYREAVQAAKLVTWEYDIPSHTIVMSDDPYTKNEHLQSGLPTVIRNVPESIVPLIEPEDLPQFLQMYRDAEQGKSASCEVWYRPVKGREPRYERLTYILIDNPDRTITRAIGLAQDITAERKVEERYQRELGYMRQNSDNNLIAKGHYNLTKNTVVEYMTQNGSIFRLTPGDNYDESCLAFAEIGYREEDRRLILENFNRQTLLTRYQHGEMQTSLQYRRRRESLLPMYVSMNIHTYMMPETGDIECFTYAYDITDKMQTDEIMGLIADEEFDYIGLIYAQTEQFEFIKKSPNILFPEPQQIVDYGACCDYVRSNFVNEGERMQFDSAVSLENITAALRAKDRHAASYRRTENGATLC